jgi:hypothetical protein
MARPGLEPGTPRFSDSRSQHSNTREKPCKQASCAVAQLRIVRCESVCPANSARMHRGLGHEAGLVSYSAAEVDEAIDDLAGVLLDRDRAIGLRVTRRSPQQAPRAQRRGGRPAMTSSLRARGRDGEVQRLLHRHGAARRTSPGACRRRPVNAGDYTRIGDRAVAVERRRKAPPRCRQPVDRVTTVQPLAYSSAARCSNSNPTNRSSPTTHASWPGG